MNISPKEADLTRLPVQDVETVLGPHSVLTPEPGASLGDALRDPESGRGAGGVAAGAGEPAADADGADAVVSDVRGAAGQSLLRAAGL